MANLKRLKRRVLRDAVTENVDLLEGRIRPRTVRRRGGWVRVAARGALAAALPVSLFASSLVLSDAKTPDPAAAAAPTARRSAAAPSTARLEAAAGGAVSAVSVFPAPRPVDPTVFPLAVRRVVVDPGHGGANRGAEADRGLLEKDLTLDLAQRLAALLETASFQVVLTRDSDDGVSLQDRAALANRSQGDIFVSIHFNWIEDRSIEGVETYFQGPTDDPTLDRLAARENSDSGYSLADLRRILDGMYADVRLDESRRLAEAVQSSLVASLRGVHPGLENRGVKRAPFLVLVATDMPAVLAEVSCLSNPAEARRLTDPRYRQELARALFAGIEAYAHQTGRPVDQRS